MSIKTFRSRIADGDTKRIRLGTNNGLTGYKVKKFQCIGADLFGSQSHEIVFKLFTAEPGTPTAEVNLDNPLLIAVTTYSSHDNAHLYGEDTTIIIDNVKFNQDVYVTLVNKQGNPANFYLELEQVKLNIDEATVATLKDMRGRE